MRRFEISKKQWNYLLVFLAIIIVLILESGNFDKKLSDLGSMLGIRRVAVGQPAPELRGDNWVNSNPLKLKSLKGKVVLLNIWTYSCVECLHTLPQIAKWKENYKELVVIGVHSPEFAFEKDQNNVLTALKRLGVEYPVILDNEMTVFSDYGNKFWPHMYLIDSSGVLRYHKIGNTGYRDTENEIIKLLNENGAIYKVLQPKVKEGDNVEFLMPEITTLIYFGMNRFDYFGNFQDQGDRTVQKVVYPAETQSGYFYLEGTWKFSEEYIRNDGAADLMITYNAAGVYLLAGADSEVKVEVTVDNSPVTPENAGPDLLIEENGRSYVKIKETRPYNIVKHYYGTNIHTLELLSGSDEVRMYTLKFES